jgi:hypothetical protein
VVVDGEKVMDEGIVVNEVKGMKVMKKMKKVKKVKK